MITEKIEISNELKGKYIFLSSSLPSADRNPTYYINTNPLDIINAIISIVENILKMDGNLIFGGHPTISPLILKVAMKFGSSKKHENNPERIQIYQSKYFESIISKYTEELLDLRLGEILWTKNIDNNRELSLNQMRVQMLKEHNISAGIFVGGMEGIEEEFNLFKEFYPQNPIYLIGSSGGATKQLYEKYFQEEKEWVFPWIYNTKELRSELYKSKIYPSLAKLVMKDISSR